MIKPSKYQAEIFEYYKNTNKNIVVSAVPGSGKTTTILELLKLKKVSRKAVFLAFNKSIVEELEKKVPPGVDVLTIHSLGCKSIFAHFKGKVEINNYKLFRIAKKIEKTFDKKVPKKKIHFYIFNLCKIVDLYRMRLESDLGAVDDIINHYDIDIIGNEHQDAIKLLNAYYEYNKTWNYNVSEKTKFIIDFADMIYLPAVNNYYMKQYDDVFIDESQDLNKAQQIIVSKVISKNGGRFVAVGDPRQSIYGFMSADLESYNNFLKYENTVELPLSFCYRCGTEIVKVANEIYDIIESPENMFEGEVFEQATIYDLNEGDFILCRNNKPLVAMYFRLIKKEIVCYIKGAEIGKAIILLISDFKKIEKNTVYEILANMLSALYSDLLEKGIKKPVSHPKYLALYEKIQIIKIVGEKYNTTLEICVCIENMFKDESKGIMLSTIHKSKGLETDNVYILDKHLIPSEYATLHHQKIQELNLLYVAFTRAKKKLGFFNS